MKKVVRIIWKSILTFDGIVFCSSVSAVVWFSLLKKLPLIDLSASTSKVICHYLFILFTITIVLNVLLGWIMIVADVRCKSDDGFEQGGFATEELHSRKIPVTLPLPPMPAPKRNIERGAPTKPNKQ